MNSEAYFVQLLSPLNMVQVQYIEIEILMVNIFQNTPKVDLSSNPYAEPNFEFYDRQLIEKMREKDFKVEQFFTLLALCHTVMPETKDGKILDSKHIGDFS